MDHVKRFININLFCFFSIQKKNMNARCDHGVAINCSNSFRRIILFLTILFLAKCKGYFISVFQMQRSLGLGLLGWVIRNHRICQS